MEKFNITLFASNGTSIAKYLGCRDLYRESNGLYVSFFRENGEYMTTNLDYLTERIK